MDRCLTLSDVITLEQHDCTRSCNNTAQKLGVPHTVTVTDCVCGSHKYCAQHGTV